jgi:hypothetical protein
MKCEKTGMYTPAPNASSRHVVSAKSELLKASLFIDLFFEGRPFARARVVDVVTRPALSWPCEIGGPIGCSFVWQPSKWFGLGVAEIAVDRFLAPAAYYLRPMDIGWAVEILRRAAVECKVREIRRPKLYEALDFRGAMPRTEMARL